MAPRRIVHPRRRADPAAKPFRRAFIDRQFRRKILDRDEFAAIAGGHHPARAPRPSSRNPVKPGNRQSAIAPRPGGLFGWF